MTLRLRHWVYSVLTLASLIAQPAMAGGGIVDCPACLIKLMCSGMTLSQPGDPVAVSASGFVTLTAVTDTMDIGTGLIPDPQFQASTLAVQPHCQAVGGMPMSAWAEVTEGGEAVVYFDVEETASCPVSAIDAFHLVVYEVESEAVTAVVCAGDPSGGEPDFGPDGRGD